MQDDHDHYAIIANDYGVFVRLRNHVTLDPVLCPLCGMDMYRLRKPPVRSTVPMHVLWLHNRVKFFACPDKEQPGHQCRERNFRHALEFWSQPLEEILAMDESEVSETRMTL